MREIEFKANNNSTKAKLVEYSLEDKKKWIKEATNAEKKIKLLETDLNELGKLMAEPDFYQRMDAAEIGSKYQQYQKQMEEAFESWEKAQFHLESN